MAEVEFEMSQYLPEHIVETMATYNVARPGESLEAYYMRVYGPATPPESEMKASLEVSRNGGIKTLEWDRYDIKAAAAGKDGFLMPGDFPTLAGWGTYVSEVESVTGLGWTGRSFEPEGVYTPVLGLGEDKEDISGLLLAGLALLLLG